MATPKTIAAEYQRALAAEKALTTALNNEITLRQATDLGLAKLASRVAALESVPPPAPPPVTPPPVTPPPPPVITPVRTTINVAQGATGIVVPAGSIDVVISGKDIIGSRPQPRKTSGEFGIRALGTAASPIKRLTLRDLTIRDFGFGGLWLEGVQELVLGPNLVIDGIGYAGIMLLSCSDVTDTGSNIVRNVGVAEWTVWQSAADGDMNAYGISMSASGGPNTQRVHLRGWTVDNVPAWHGIDGHSASDVTIEDCLVSHCNRAYWASSPYGRSRNWVLNMNRAEQPTRRPDVKNTSPYNETAFNFFSVDGVAGVGNVAAGWPSGNDLGASDCTAVSLQVAHA